MGRFQVPLHGQVQQAAGSMVSWHRSDIWTGDVDLGVINKQVVREGESG